MSIWSMDRARALPAAALVALLALPGCSGAGASAGDDDDRVEAAQAMAGDALEVAEELGIRVDDLEDELERARTRRGLLAKRVHKMAGRLSDAVASLRTSIADARADAGSAHGDAASALERAAGLARQLAVLESRLDYHLRSHGG
ncbi:MAG: hypothetical protein ABR575_08705 [Actinomycetota bacterium]